MPEPIADTAQRVTLHDVVVIANTVKDAIVAQYKTRDKFTDIERCPVEGLISQCAGALSLLLLANGFPKEIELGKAWEDVVFPEARKVFTYIKEKGFDATPFMAAEKTVRIGIGKKLPYIDSLTWVLSLTLHLRLAQQKKRVTLPNDIEIEMAPAIKETLERICEAMHPEGGWGFIKDCSSPDLYFSYAVSEALADFGDYVLGETLDIAEKDVELMEALSRDESKIIERVATAREKTSAWLINNYLRDLGEKLIVPDIKPDDFQPYHSLYYTYFVIDMLIVLGSGEIFHKDRRKEILKAIEHGIYLSRITLDRARADTAWFDSKKSELRLGWHNHAKSPSLMAGDSIKEPGLVPLSVRCNALYAYYIMEGPVKEIDGLFDLLCENRDEATGLWDNQGFDLMITERAVEALVDYADYLRENDPASQVAVVAKKPDLKFTSPVDPGSLFLSCVRAAVKEVLEADDLATQLTGRKKAEDADASNSTDIGKAKLLNSIVLSLEHGRTSTDNNVALLHSQLKLEIRDIMDEIFLDSIRGNVRDEAKLELIETQYQSNKVALRNAILSFLAEDPKISSGDLFAWLNKKYVAESVGRGGRK
jgi:hypothetical protein